MLALREASVSAELCLWLAKMSPVRRCSLDLQRLHTTSLQAHRPFAGLFERICQLFDLCLHLGHFGAHFTNLLVCACSRAMSWHGISSRIMSDIWASLWVHVALHFDDESSIPPQSPSPVQVLLDATDNTACSPGRIFLGICPSRA